MNLKIYVNKIFFKEYIFNDNCNLKEIVEELKKIGGKYYLFTTLGNSWIFLYESYNYPGHFDPGYVDIRDIRGINEPPIILSKKVYIFNDNEILKYKILYEKFLHNKIDYKIFSESLNKFLSK